MDKSLKKLLVEALNSKKIVSIHTNPLSQSECSVGFVDRLSDEEVRIRAISPNGEYAGYEVRSIDVIYRVDINGMYEKKINSLWNSRGKIFKENKLNLTVENDLIAITTLKEAYDKKMVVILWTEDKEDSIVGYIDEVNEETVKILSIDEFGRDDGSILVNLAEVVCVDCDTLKCQKIKFLHENYKE